MKKKTFAIDIDGTITENGGGRIHLDALSALRHLTTLGHNVVFVTGRSSVEAYLLSIFGGTSRIAVGENGGCITHGDYQHIQLGNIDHCKKALSDIQSCMDVVLKPVFPRMTEIVLERTFDLDAAKSLVSDDVILADSQFAYHINSSGVNKGAGFSRVMEMLEVDSSDVIAMGDSETDISLFDVSGTSVALGNAFDEVKKHASMTVCGHAGDGVLEALNLLAPGWN